MTSRLTKIEIGCIEQIKKTEKPLFFKNICEFWDSSSKISQK